MKKILLTTTMLLLCVGMAKAQWLPVSVNPGSKGALPTVNFDNVPQAPEQLPPTLWLKMVSTSVEYGENIVYADLSFQYPNVFEANAIVIEERALGEETWTDHGSFYTGGVSTPIKYSKQFRARISGGPQDGMVSNVVTAHMPNRSTRFNGYTDGRNDQVIVGVPIDRVIELRMVDLEASAAYDDDSGYFRYSWYRMNPYTYEMTPIEGADGMTYTPTMDDLGYDLVYRINGDNEHCSFEVNEVIGYDGVNVAVLASVAAAAPDGVLVYTDYELPSPETMLSLYKYDEETWELVAVPAEITTLGPGQYAFKCNRDDYEWGTIDLTEAGRETGYKFYAVFERAGYGGGSSYRPINLEGHSVMMPMGVSVLFNGEALPTTVEAYGRNIFTNDYTLEGTVELTAESYEGVEYFNDLYVNDYLLLAKATEGTEDTYYPNATSQARARLVNPGYDLETFAPFTYVINAQAPGSTPTAINALQADGTQEFFTPDGRQGRVKGLNLVRMSDGTVKKVVVE